MKVIPEAYSISRDGRASQKEPDRTGRYGRRHNHRDSY